MARPKTLAEHLLAGSLRAERHELLVVDGVLPVAPPTVLPPSLSAAWKEARGLVALVGLSADREERAGLLRDLERAAQRLAAVASAGVSPGDVRNAAMRPALWRCADHFRAHEIELSELGIRSAEILRERVSDEWNVWNAAHGRAFRRHHGIGCRLDRVQHDPRRPGYDPSLLPVDQADDPPEPPWITLWSQR
ncbi:MAG: hypothetical protein ACKVUT_14220 [Gaiella sp.]